MVAVQIMSGFMDNRSVPLVTVTSGCFTKTADSLEHHRATRLAEARGPVSAKVRDCVSVIGSELHDFPQVPVSVSTIKVKVLAGCDWSQRRLLSFDQQMNGREREKKHTSTAIQTQTQTDTHRHTQRNTNEHTHTHIHTPLIL